MRVRLCREARSSKTSLVMQEISKSGILHYYDTTFLSHKPENSPGQSTAPISLVVYSSLSFPSYLLLLANRPRILSSTFPFPPSPLSHPLSILPLSSHPPSMYPIRFTPWNIHPPPTTISPPPSTPSTAPLITANPPRNARSTAKRRKRERGKGEEKRWERKGKERKEGT